MDGVDELVVVSSVAVEAPGELVVVVASVVDVAVVEDGSSDVVGEIVVDAGPTVVDGAALGADVDVCGGRVGGGATAHGELNATGR